MTKKVHELMIDKSVTVSEDEEIFEVANKVTKDCETLLVCVVDKENKLIGMITPKELLKAAEVSEYGNVRHPFFSGREALHLLSSDHARDIMSAPVSVKPDDEVQMAIDLMLRNNLNEIPVVDKDSRVIGEVNFMDIISHSVWQRDTGRE